MACMCIPVADAHAELPGISDGSTHCKRPAELQLSQRRLTAETSRLNDLETLLSVGVDSRWVT